MFEAQRRRRRHGLRSIETSPLRGQFLFAQQVIDTLEGFLPTYRGADGSHEGIAFLCGFELGKVTLLTTAVAPDADHGPGHVHCSESQMGEVSRAARALGLGLLGQVHTHPTSDATHSFGDDDLVLMPFEGMLSVVCPLYARFGLLPLYTLGVHQFQDGRWILAEPGSVRDQVALLPAGVDLR